MPLAFKHLALPGSLLLLAPSAAALGAPDLHQIAGRYAHYDVVAYEDQLPIGAMRSLVITYGFSDFTVVGGQLVETDAFCHAEQKSNLPIQTTVLDSFTRAIVPRSTPVAVGEANGQWTITRPETPTGIGIRLASPNEHLPTDPHDPRLVDDDHDGKPGVTVYINLGFTTGELYLARREVFAYDLQRREEGRWEGVVRDHSEQLVVGADPAFLASPRNPVQQADLSKSPILLVRVANEYTCEQLMAERDQLFPPTPAVWEGL